MAREAQPIDVRAAFTLRGRPDPSLKEGPIREADRLLARMCQRTMQDGAPTARRSHWAREGLPRLQGLLVLLRQNR